MDKNNNKRWVGLALAMALVLILGCESSGQDNPASLSEARTAQLLADLPPLKQQPDDQKDFVRGAESPPPPRPGEVVEGQFPPAESAGPAPEDELKAPQLLRYYPLGDIDRAELLSLTFSEPMTALGSHAEQTFPEIEITPRPEGLWRWLDTQTLVYESPKDRFPMATEFTVNVPETIKSQAGVNLTQAYSWSFSTPALKLESSHPNSAQPMSARPVLVLVFNQPVDSQALLPFISLERNGEKHRLEIASEKQIDEDINGARNFVKSLEREHYLALIPERELPKDVRARLVLQENAPALEGDRRTARAQGFNVSVHGPLKLVEARCGWGDQGCRPGEPWELYLSHGLAKQDLSQQVEIEPELPDARIELHGDKLHIAGDSQPQTEYRVTLKAGTIDQFDQVLGEPITSRFKVLSHAPGLMTPHQNMVVLEANGAMRLPVFTRNLNRLELELRRVQPADYQQLMPYGRQVLQSGISPNKNSDVPAPGRRVVHRTIELNAPQDQWHQTEIDLQEALEDDEYGHLLVSVRAPELDTNEHRWGQQLPARMFWVQVTDLGVSLRTDPVQALAWANDLASGEPLEGVEIVSGEQHARTDSEGLAQLEVDSSLLMLLARKGSDSAFISCLGHHIPGDCSWHLMPYGHTDGYELLMFDDRGLYQPGETLHLKGLVRALGKGPRGDIHWPGGIEQMGWTLHDDRQRELGTGRALVSAEGSFDLEVAIPADANLGYGYLEVGFFGGDANEKPVFERSHNFLIQEFRRPEYRVQTHWPQGPHFAGEEVDVTAEASYYSGSPLPNAEVDWTLVEGEGHYSPPGWSDYQFGRIRHWWYHQTEETYSKQEYSGRTGADGRHSLSIMLGKSGQKYPLEIASLVQVTDINRQVWQSDSEQLVHPAAIYVGVKTERRFVAQGEPIESELIAVDLNGKVVSGRPIQVTVEQLEWRESDWQVQATQQCQVTSSTEPVNCQFDTDDDGKYRLTAKVTDTEARVSQTQTEIWVGEASPIEPKTPTPSVSLLADQDSYRPGETARIKIKTPFAPAHALVTLKRQGIWHREMLRLEEGEYSLDIPIDESALPSLTLQVEAVGRAVSEDGVTTEPAQAIGELNLPVSTESRELTVTLTAKHEQLKPGEQAEVSVQVKDHGGAPVAGELTLYAVDESVLDLAGYELPQPMDVFYAERPDLVREFRLRDFLWIPKSRAEPETSGVEEIMVSGLRASESVMRMEKAMSDAPTSASAGGASTPLRSNFSALATFKATVPVGADGTAEIKFQLPDNLTRYRVMAVVHREQQFGSGQTDIEVGLPLMVRPSLPRFLNLGDTAELPVVVQNTTDKAMTVEVALRASNLELAGPMGRRITIPAGDRRELLFTARPKLAGTARVQVIVKSDKHSDAAQVELPVLTPATTEAFAQYGSLTDAVIKQSVLVPGDVYPDYGGLELSFSSTQFQSLTDAFVYLVDYPYGCAEQIASRVIASVTLRDLLAAFAADKLPPEEKLEASLQKDLARLAELQNYDGGWSFWTRNDNSQAYLSAHVTHALLRASEAGYELPENTLEEALDYLRGLENPLPEEAGKRQSNAVRAYALYLREMAGDSVADQAQQLFAGAEEDELSSETLGWLLSVVEASNTRDEIIRRLNNRLRETAATASFVSDYEDGGYRLLYGGRRTDAVVLDALLEIEAEGDLVEKLARDLLQQRRHGHWGNTQENVFVLLALKHYFEVREAEVPNLTARAWLGEQFLGQHRFEGRSTESFQTQVPMATLLEGAKQRPLTLQSEGSGRLYYRLGLRYAPADLRLEAASHGLAVERVYEAINDPEDVKQRADGRWQIRAGAAVRVKLAFTAPARRHHLALVDYLPAGFEALNPALQSTPDMSERPPSESRFGGEFWHWRWYEHQQMRDERVEAFATQVGPGKYEYQYTALATTPGEFIAPPAKAEEMYHPETFGRSATDRVIITSTP